jgi:peptidyl-prolyl cis-trans isomerase A (cyclophilin A)
MTLFKSTTLSHYRYRLVFTCLLLIMITAKGVAQKNPVCLIKTSLGNISIELFAAKAPITVANFLKYVDARLYDSSSLFRAVTLLNQPKDSIKIEVIQGGDIDSLKDFAPIPLESTQQTGLRHKNGTVSMARSGPATATSSFFICINDQPALDYGGKRNKDGQGFAAFGQVIAGMEVVKKIQGLYPDQGQYFKPVIRIVSVTRQ